MDPASAELVDQFRQGDERAASDLFVRYVERLTALVRAQMTPALRRRVDPEDAVHSAYRSFFIRAREGQFVLGRSGELWKLLVTITLNKLRRLVARHRARKRGMQRDRALGESIEMPASPSPLEALAAADELASFMAKLNPLQRQVLQLRMQEERWDDIARATGRSPRTVRRVLEDIQRIWRGMAAEQNISEFEPKTLVFPAGEPSAVLSKVSNEPPAPLDYRDFVLEKLIGAGGMGKVYRARQKVTGQIVAIKMLRKVRWTRPGAVERFLDEARIVRQLRHPGIVAVQGIGRTPGGGPFIVMEFVNGDNLAIVSRTRGATLLEAIGWAAEAADALHYAHQQGILHCDLKPSNVLREHTGRIVLTDFGLAATRSETGKYQLWGGTPEFMAPEQLDPAFGEIGPATDIFSLGLVLYNLVTGQTLLGDRTVAAVLADWDNGSAISREAIKASDIPDGLTKVLERCLAIDPAARYSSARELAEAIKMFLRAAQ